jgi:hypothetical protein
MDSGGRCGGASCDGAGIIVIEGLGSDDGTPQDRIGYRFSWAEGRLPAGMTLSGEALDMPIFDGRFELEWNDGVSGDQEALAFARRRRCRRGRQREPTPATPGDGPRLRGLPGGGQRRVDPRCDLAGDLGGDRSGDAATEARVRLSAATVTLFEGSGDDWLLLVTALDEKPASSGERIGRRKDRAR